jgi:hypothetical protein
MSQKADMRWIPASETIPANSQLPFRNLIPVLFWGIGIDRKTSPFAEMLPNDSVIFYADIIAASLFMLSRWEETIIPFKDEHGRFPASYSTAYKLGFLNIPLIDYYGLILREWIKNLVPGWTPQKNIPAVNLTYDIDHIYQYSNPLSFARTFKIALMSKNPLGNIRHELKQLKTQFFSPERGDKYQTVIDLASSSKKFGFTSRFYFMSAKPHLKQQGYNPAKPCLQKLYKFLQEQGHEIGFHPGYRTHKNPKLLKKEKDRLEQACGTIITGGRQHFLRFEAPVTWRDWEHTGLVYDSTLGYADHEGFRCGTCHPFKPFDLENDREINLIEVPLIIMDGTLSDYRMLSTEQAQVCIMDLARKCIEVEGTFTLLWHNTMLLHENTDWKSTYLNVLQQLKELLLESESQ